MKDHQPKAAKSQSMAYGKGGQGAGFAWAGHRTVGGTPNGNRWTA